jgi:hypothetical protein
MIPAFAGTSLFRKRVSTPIKPGASFSGIMLYAVTAAVPASLLNTALRVCPVNDG